MYVEERLEVRMLCICVQEELERRILGKKGLEVERVSPDMHHKHGFPMDLYLKLKTGESPEQVASCFVLSH